MPGAVPTLWCDLHGVSKDEQRGIVQPFMLVIQCLAILMLVSRPGHDLGYLRSVGFALPAVAGGTWLGLKLFGRVQAGTFRGFVLCLLLISGLTLVL
jgi:hypothetical protein